MEPHLTIDQRYVLRILRETGFLRRGQIERLLLNKKQQMSKGQLETILRQLLHTRKIQQVKGTDLISGPYVLETAPDYTVLDCIDIMLDLGGQEIVALTKHAPPFALRFAIGQGDDVKGFGIIVVPQGKEKSVSSCLLGELEGGVTPILKLDTLDSRALLHLERPCYFVVWDGQTYRYFRGGEADES